MKLIVLLILIIIHTVLATQYKHITTPSYTLTNHDYDTLLILEYTLGHSEWTLLEADVTNCRVLLKTGAAGSLSFIGNVLHVGGKESYRNNQVLEIMPIDSDGGYIILELGNTGPQWPLGPPKHAPQALFNDDMGMMHTYTSANADPVTIMLYLTNVGETTRILWQGEGPLNFAAYFDNVIITSVTMPILGTNTLIEITKLTEEYIYISLV